MKRKYDMFSKSDMRKFSKVLEKDAFNMAREQAKNTQYDYKCPECGKEMKIKQGISKCPHCQKKFNIDLKIDF